MQQTKGEVRDEERLALRQNNPLRMGPKSPNWRPSRHGDRISPMATIPMDLRIPRRLNSPNGPAFPKAR